MTIASTVWLTAFGVVAYIFLIDPNVPLFINLLSQGAGVKLRRVKFFVWENPDLPWVRWRIEKHWNRQARILRKELGLPKD